MLRDELEAILENGTDEEKEILALTVNAIKRRRERRSTYISSFLGLQGEFIDEETYQFIVPITPFMLNSLGIVHGGISATLADCTMGSLINQSLPDNVGVVTSEMKLNYMRPGLGKYLVSRAKRVSMGNKLCVAECRIETDQGKLVAIAIGTFFIIRKKT